MTALKKLNPQTQLIIKRCQDQLDVGVERVQEDIADLQKDLRSMRKSASSSTVKTLEEKLNKLTKQKVGMQRVGLDGLLNDEKDALIKQGVREAGVKLARKLGALVNNPWNADMAESLGMIDRQLTLAAGRIDRIRDELSPLVKNKANGLSGPILELDEVVRCAEAIKKAADLVEQFEVGNPTKPSRSYPYAEQRGSLAQECGQSAWKQLKKLKEFDGEFLAFVFAIQDARKTYNLGAVLLDGEPKKIIKAVDAAEWDPTPDGVWMFKTNLEDEALPASQRRHDYKPMPKR